MHVHLWSSSSRRWFLQSPVFVLYDQRYFPMTLRKIVLVLQSALKISLLTETHLYRIAWTVSPSAVAATASEPTCINFSTVPVKGKTRQNHPFLSAKQGRFLATSVIFNKIIFKNVMDTNHRLREERATFFELILFE